MTVSTTQILKGYTVMSRMVAFSIIFIILLIILFCNGSDKTNDEPDPTILNVYKLQAQQRKNQLKLVPDSGNYFVLYNILVPEVFCKDLVRIGKVTDGGKWICNPNAMFDFSRCTIYSLGINNDPSFDVEFQTFLQNKCQLRSFDKGYQRPDTIKRIEKSNGVFMKAFISGTTNQSNDQYTFKDILTLYGDTRIDILKIDIEGSEFDISDELISVSICQILIEIHGKTAKKTLDLLQKLSQNGYLLFSYEINGAFHHLSEYSFIHESCLSDYNVNIVYGKYLS